jgi:hypothetical protein
MENDIEGRMCSVHSMAVVLCCVVCSSVRCLSEKLSSTSLEYFSAAETNSWQTRRKVQLQLFVFVHTFAEHAGGVFPPKCFQRHCPIAEDFRVYVV